MNSLHPSGATTELSRSGGVAHGALNGSNPATPELHQPDIDELFYYYQPILGPDGKPVIYEALVRWLSPDGIILPPVHFLPELLHSDEATLAAFTAHTIESAAQVLNDNPRVPRLSINLSPAQICRHETVAHLASLSYAIRSRLMVEVTENQLPELEVYSLWLGETAAMGVDLVLDDVLPQDLDSRLPPKLPVEGVKLDRSLLPKLLGPGQDAGLLDVVRSLARLKLSLTVEGVEQPGHLPALAALGFDRFQGYGLGMPLPALDSPSRSHDARSDTGKGHALSIHY